MECAKYRQSNILIVTAFCATVGFGLESANIVGYSTTTIRSGYTLLIPAFDNVGSEGMDIQKIVPNTDATGVNIQTFTDSAEGDTMYYNVPTGKAGAGWYTNARGTATTYAVKSFEPGEGFMVYLPSSMNVKFQSAE